MKIADKECYICGYPVYDGNDRHEKCVLAYLHKKESRRGRIIEGVEQILLDNSIKGTYYQKNFTELTKDILTYLHSQQEEIREGLLKRLNEFRWELQKPDALIDTDSLVALQGAVADQILSDLRIEE